MISKTKANKIHARRRCNERYGQSLSNKKIAYITKTIRKQRAKLIKRSSNTRTVWDVKYGNDIYRVVYSSVTKDIVTVLPKTKEIK